MRLKDALSRIEAPTGFSSLMHAALSGDFSGLDRNAVVGTTLDEARKRLADVEEQQANCKSDYAFWGYMGEISAWRAAVSLLEAAELVGPNNLPDIEFHARGIAVMDCCASVERWGRTVLAAAKSMPPTGRD